MKPEALHQDNEWQVPIHLLEQLEHHYVKTDERGPCQRKDELIDTQLLKDKSAFMHSALAGIHMDS